MENLEEIKVLNEDLLDGSDSFEVSLSNYYSLLITLSFLIFYFIVLRYFKTDFLL